MKKNISKYKIERGDKVFARLSLGGRTLVEFMMNEISSIGEVISELRRMSGEVRGLAKLYVRNHSRGWSFDQGLMIYSTREPIRQRPVTYGVLPLDFEEGARC
ncbi:MAG: hypothetical protein K2H46_07535 [Muribaculaceae bacterium]|nr:hypothetical protein [Muribaculaceae bacterium]